MKTSTLWALSQAAVAALALPSSSASIEERATVPGFDISHYQASVNFVGAYNSGARFVIIKVTFSPFPLPLFPSFPTATACKKPRY